LKLRRHGCGYHGQQAAMIAGSMTAWAKAVGEWFDELLTAENTDATQACFREPNSRETNARVAG
jgi:hypothetical protein